MKSLFSSIALAAIAINAHAQNSPGDDFVNSCVVTQTPVTYWSGSTSCNVDALNPSRTCQALGFLSGTFAEQLQRSVTLRGTGTLYCVGQLPVPTPISCTVDLPNSRQAVETKEQCTRAPKEPFNRIGFPDSYCNGGAFNGYLDWTGQAGQTFELERSVRGATFTRLSAAFVGWVSVPTFGETHVYRLRTTANGQTGSWAYARLYNGCTRNTQF